MTTAWLEPNTKQCTRCKRVLLLHDFPRKGAHYPQLRSECRYCAVERTRKSRARREEREPQKEELLGLWEIKSFVAGANPRIVERGKVVADNLRGTPADCLRGKSLMEDLRWLLSRLDTDGNAYRKHHE